MVKLVWLDSSQSNLSWSSFLPTTYSSTNQSLLTTSIMGLDVTKNQVELSASLTTSFLHLLSCKFQSQNNVFGVTEKEEMFKSGVDMEHCCVQMLKKMLWIFAANMGKGGCPICTCFSPPFWAKMLKFQPGLLDAGASQCRNPSYTICFPYSS